MDDVDTPVATSDAPVDVPEEPIDDAAAAVRAWRERRASGRPVTVEVVASDDPPAATGFGAKLRGFIANGGSSASDDDDAPGRRTRRPQVKPDDVATGIIIPILGLAFLAVPPHVRMRQDEMHAVAMPLARILLRRFKVLRRMSPDVIDAIAILAAITMYVRRLDVERAQRMEIRRRVEEQQRASGGSGQQRNGGGPIGGPYTFTGSDPLAAYLGGTGG